MYLCKFLQVPYSISRVLDFLLNLLGWHWLIELYGFQVYNSIIHHLCVHHRSLILKSHLLLFPLLKSEFPKVGDMCLSPSHLCLTPRTASRPSYMVATNLLPEFTLFPPLSRFYFLLQPPYCVSSSNVSLAQLVLPVGLLGEVCIFLPWAFTSLT